MSPNVFTNCFNELDSDLFKGPKRWIRSRKEKWIEVLLENSTKSQKGKYTQQPVWWCSHQVSLQPGCVGEYNNLTNSENWKHQRDTEPYPPLPTSCSITQADSRVRKDNNHLQAFGILTGQTQDGELKRESTTKTDEFKCKKWHKCQPKCPNGKIWKTASWEVWNNIKSIL